MTWKETHWRTRAFREYPWTLSCMQVCSSRASFASACWAGSFFWCQHWLRLSYAVVKRFLPGALVGCTSSGRRSGRMVASEASWTTVEHVCRSLDVLQGLKWPVNGLLHDTGRRAGLKSSS